MRADLSLPHISSESFERIYKREWALKRHRALPLVPERDQFLTYLLVNGSNKTSVQAVATALLRAIRAMRLQELRAVSRREIEETIRKLWGRRLMPDSRFKGHHSAYLFRWAVIKWLRFHHRFKCSVARPAVHETRLNAFTNFLKCKQFTTLTIESHRNKVVAFLRWLSNRHTPLLHLSATDLQDFVSSKKREGWSLATLCSTAQAIKCFLRYAAGRKWCRPGLAEMLKTPRCSKFAARCQAREWSEVRQLLASLKGQDHAAVRAKAALLIVATYALRSAEIARLRIGDFDWEKQTLSVRRSKNGLLQRYPLCLEVAEAVLNYIKIRPDCNSDQLFVTIKTPYRPVRQKSFYSITSHRLKKIGINTGRRGPHSIRHAKAMYLLRRGASLKQIGDFLGHRNPESPLIYAKFDVKLLRQVADFKLRDLL
jgi:integrase/recombinase XerD